MSREIISRAEAALNEMSGAITASAPYARNGGDVSNIKRTTLIDWRMALSRLLAEAREG